MEHPDQRVAAVAARQHGQITTRQLRACGLSRRQIQSRTDQGWLHRSGHGVYSVGVPARGDAALGMAAALSVRDGTLAGRSASGLWAFWRSRRSREHVIGPRQARSRPGLRITRQRLDPQDVTRLDGIPITTVARTLLDLAAELPERQLREALANARVRRLVTDDQLRDVLARHPRHRGTRALGDALTGPFTRSRLERAFHALLSGLPAPLVNRRIGGDECDFVWPAARLVVEIDGPHHAGQWAQDAARDARLRAQGWTVLRFTAWDVERDGARTLAHLREALHRDERPA